jgi:hypothetical protein
MTATEIIGRIGETADMVKSDKAHVIPFMDVGDELRQGDIYVTRIESVPELAVKVETPSGQLAPGTNQGSRHCLRSLSGVKLYTLAEPRPLDGPIIEARKPFWVDHPEHGNRRLPAGVYAVTYQRAFAEELRRVQD